MDQQTLARIKDLLSKNDKIAIAVGKNPTIDTMGSALALYLTLLNAGLKVTVATPNDPLVEVSSLVGINKVAKTLGSEGGDLIVAFPYKTKENGESEIQKVSYTLEDNYLNIVVKAGADGLSFNEKDVKYRRSGSVPQLLFVVGTPRLSDLGQLFDPQALKETTVINIDNSNQNQQFGDVVLVSSAFSSVSEQVAEFIISLGYEMGTDIAQNLLSGIAFATDNFQKPQTSALAFEMAGLLLKHGAVRPKVVQQFQRQTDSGINSFVPQQRNQQSNFAGQQQKRPFEQRQQDFQPRIKQQQPFKHRQQFVQQFNQTTGQNQMAGTSQQEQPFQQPVREESQSEVSMRSQQPQHNQNPQPQTRVQEAPVAQKDNAAPDAPPDWLTPKVYKGSTLV